MAPSWVARALKSQVKRIGNAQPNGFSEIAHEWLKILQGLKKNLHEWVNDLFPLLWFHRLTQTMVWSITEKNLDFYFRTKQNNDFEK